MPETTLDERFSMQWWKEQASITEELLVEPTEFNGALIPWLLWYNGERPYSGLNLKSPVQFLME
jgi:hypothetical protein